MSSGPATSAYLRSGVDLDASESTREGIRALVESTRTALVHAGFGAFGGAFALPWARAGHRFRAAYGPAEKVPVEVRGSGPATRQLTNFFAPVLPFIWVNHSLGK